MARPKTHLGRKGRTRMTTFRDETDPLWSSAPPYSSHSSRAPGSQSAGYHYDATPSGPPHKTQTPIVAPTPEEAATAPAGDYAGAGRDYRRAVAALPPPVRRPAPFAPQPLLASLSPRGLTQLGQAAGRLLSPGGALQALLGDGQHPQQDEPSPAPVAPPRAADPATAVFSSREPASRATPPAWEAPRGPRTSPVDPLGKKTLGNVSLAELRQAGQEGTLRINRAGVISTPGPRQALQELRDARQKVAASGADIGSLHRQFPELSGRWLRALGRAQRMTGTPAPLLAGILSQESDYGRSTLPGVHSGQNFAGAAGPFQIGNGTGAAGNAWDQVAGELWGPRADQHSIYRPEDAALGAGRYLQTFPSTPASKDRSTWYDAALSYNHADWYAQDVVDQAQRLSPLGRLGKPSSPAAREQLQEAERNAREVGLNPSGHHGLGPVAPQVMDRFGAGLKAAKQLEHLGLPYSWGGGHDAAFRPGGEGENGGPGYDCSGSVSYVLHAMGVLDSPLTSGAMGQVLDPGPGAVTVYYNAGHTFMKIGKRYFGTSNSNPSGGAGFIDPSIAKGEAESGAYSVGHVRGLGKKVALQLGIKPGELNFGSSGGASDGMVYSADGTEATIAPGAGTTVGGSARYSNAPIELTHIQAPLSAGPVMPDAYGGAPADEGHVESAAQSILSLLGEDAAGVGSLTSRRRPTLT